ncbi:Fur-regulated basic protein FbpA [Psychrobacillus sp. FJAT-51614]|uniref:Fur-regulated basic protein FbpA n=1 Tax=Psychrobacillus mangrovi TaxID=3117745 RepID=A0ABU8F5G4_9BACI
MIIPKESKIEEKRDNMIEDLVNKGVFKIDGRQLYELNLYELTKEYITEEEN